MSSTPVLQSQDGSSVAKTSTFAPRNRIRNEDHRNWIRCNLGLQEIADAIRPHVEQTFRDYWESTFWWCCHNRCDQPDCGQSFPHCHCESSIHSCPYWYDHNHTENLYCPIKRRDDSWYIYTKKDCTACKDQFKKVLNLFIDQNSPKIYWGNVQFPIKDKGPWEIAKAFMPQGNKKADTPDQAEGIALVNVINTCKLFDRTEKFDHNLADKLIIKRNDLTHSASHEVTLTHTDEIFDLMITLLQQVDRTCKCPTQLENLRQLRTKELTGELIDRAFAKSVQTLMNEISDRLATGEEASQLMERLKSTIEMQKQHSVSEAYEVEVEELKKDLAKENENLKTQLHSKNEIIKNLEETLKEMQRDNKMTISQLEEEKKEMLLKDWTIQDLESKIHEQMKEMLLKHETIEKLETELNELQKQKEKMQQEKTKELLLKDENIQRLETRLCELQSENEKMRQEKTKELLLKNETIERLKKELSELQAENEKMQQEQTKKMLLKDETIKRLETQLIDLQSENEKMRKEQVKELLLKNETIKRLETTLNELQAENKKMQEEQMKELLLKNETIKTLEEELNELQAENEKMRLEEMKQLFHNREIIENLVTKLRKLQAENDKIRQEPMKDLIFKYETIKTLEKELDELKDENMATRLKLKEQEKETITKTEALLKTERDRNELKEENEKIRLELQENIPERTKKLQIRLIEMQNETERTRCQLQEQLKEKIKLQADMEELGVRNKRLKEAVDIKVHEIESLLHEKDKIKKLYTEQRQNLDEIVQKLDRVSAEKIRLDSMINDLQNEVSLKEEKIYHLNRSNNEKSDEIRSVHGALVISNIVTVIITVYFMKIAMILY